MVLYSVGASGFFTGAMERAYHGLGAGALCDTAHVRVTRLSVYLASVLLAGPEDQRRWVVMAGLTGQALVTEDDREVDEVFKTLAGGERSSSGSTEVAGTQPSDSSAPIDPNKPNMTPEERLRLRRQQEIRR